MGAVMGYTEHTTANEVIAGVDLSGKVALVTGSSGGIGLETAREFAGVGATVVLANRDAAKSAAAADEIRSSVPGAQVETIALDLASLASVREFAATVGAAHPQIHLLVNNAGVMATPHGRTADDHELQFGTNHLGHFLLTNLLMPNLLAGAPARIVNLSSSAHDIAGIDFDDPDYRTRTYNAWVAYGQSKTANILFTVELERRYAASGVHAFAVHPGVVDTDLFRYLGEADAARVSKSIAKGGILHKSPQQGAATSVYCATDAAVLQHGGAYCEDSRVSTAAEYATDPDIAVRLWALSEELVGQQFPA